MTRLSSLLWVLLFATPVGAQEKPWPLPPPPPSSTARLAHDLVSGLSPGDKAETGSETYQIHVSFLRPPRASDPAAFADFVGDALAVALRRRGFTGTRSRTAEDADLTLSVVLKLREGHLVATATLRRWPRTIWERLRLPRGWEAGTAHTNVPLDLEIRSVLGLQARRIDATRIRLRSLSKVMAPALRRSPILAMVIRDLDDDRLPEVVFLRRDAMVLARWQRKGFRRLLDEVPLDAAPNTARLRQPIGALATVVDEAGKTLLIAASSDAAGATFWRVKDARWQRATQHPVEAAWPFYGTKTRRFVAGEWPRGTDIIAGALREVDLGEGGGQSLGPSTQSYTINAFGHARLGVQAMTSVILEPGDLAKRVAWDPAALEVSSDHLLRMRKGNEVRVLGSFGTAVWLGDVNVDGTPEILTTSTALNQEDVLTLHTLHDDGTLTEVWKSTLPGLVSALAFGDLDRDGKGEFLVAHVENGESKLSLIETAWAR